MKKLVFFFLLQAAVVAAASAATVPDWYDEESRRAAYPESQYFTGFAEGQRTGGETMEEAVERLKNAARVEAVGTIRVHIRNTSVNTSASQTLRTMEGTFMQSTRDFSSSTQTSVDMDVPGLKVESRQNAEDGSIAAFAYVKKSSLIRLLERRITAGLTRAETSLDQTDMLIASGQKVQARETAQRALSLLGETDEAQKTLVAVDENADEESLQLEETRVLQKRLTAVIAELKNGVKIYLVCRATLSGSDYPALKSEIMGVLGETGCTFVSSAAESDWAIYVKASERQYNKAKIGGTATYFSYVDATVTIDKTTTAQRVFENSLSEKGGHTHNYEQAARQAYRDISPKISGIITKQIRR